MRTQWHQWHGIHEQDVWCLEVACDQCSHVLQVVIHARTLLSSGSAVRPTPSHPLLGPHPARCLRWLQEQALKGQQAGFAALFQAAAASDDQPLRSVMLRASANLMALPACSKQATHGSKPGAHSMVVCGKPVDAYSYSSYSVAKCEKKPGAQHSLCSHCKFCLDCHGVV